MDGRPEKFQGTPAAIRLLTLRDRTTSDEFWALLDESWLELWYAFDPTDLRRLIEAHPPVDPIGPSAALLVSMTGAGVKATARTRVPRSGDDLSTRVNIASRDAASLRLQGRPLAALELFRDIEADVRQLTGPLMDTSEGVRAMFALQAGATALLAGDHRTALGYLHLGSTSPDPVRFPFAPRDLDAKTALVHALSGQVLEARRWWEKARSRARTGSWVESLVDGTLWLVDYMCTVEALDFERAEVLRLEKPSPLQHFEWWGVALLAQVRHLAVTRRPDVAQHVCDAVAAAGLPQPGADGWQAVVLAEAQLMVRAPNSEDQVRVLPTSPQLVLSRRIEAFRRGRHEVATLAVPAEAVDLHGDARPGLALRVLRAQALHERGEVDRAEALLVETLQVIRDRGVLSVLSFLTPRGLELVSSDPVGAWAAETVARCGLSLLTPSAPASASLTESEVDVLRLLAQGQTRTEIAESLCLSVNTVKTHLARAYRKLGVTTRAQAIVRARQLLD